MEIWTLKEILVRPQKAKRRAVEKHVSLSLENTCIVKSRILIQNVKGAPSEVSYRNKNSVIGNWGKVDPFHKGAENLAELCSSVG